MPAMASITVKKNDGTTDIIYTALAPSSWDGVAAQWRVETGFAHSAAKPRLSLSSRYNGPKTARRIDMTYVYPHTSTDSTTGLTSVVASVPITLSCVVPMTVPDTVVFEAVSQFANLNKDALIRGSLNTGYAPT